MECSVATVATPVNVCLCSIEHPLDVCVWHTPVVVATEGGVVLKRSGGQQVRGISDGGVFV